MDSKGQTYFSDVNRNVVWKIGVNGSVANFVTGKHSHEFFIYSSDNLYGMQVAYDQSRDRWLSHRWKAAPDGRVSVVSDGEADQIFGLLDGSGNKYLFVSDAHKRIAKVLKLHTDGDTALFAGGAWGDKDGAGPQAQFRNFGPAILGPDKAFYVGSGGIVRRLDLNGTVATIAGKQHGFGGPDEPRASGFLGISADHHGNVFAAHWEKGVVVKIANNGTVTYIFSSSMGWFPSGVLALNDGILVLEHRAGVTSVLEKAGFGGPRIRRVSADGKASVVGSAP